MHAIGRPHCDRREYNVVSYTLLLSLIELKARVARDDLEGALTLLPNIPTVRGPLQHVEAK